MLDTIYIPDCVRCNDCHCDLSKHKHSIGIFCLSIIKSCLGLSKDCIPNAGLKKNNKEMPRWSDQVAPEKDCSLLWHWIWCESGSPNSGFIYDIMKRTLHQYHYAV